MLRPTTLKLDKSVSTDTDGSSDDNAAVEGVHSAAVGFMANEFIVRDVLNIIKAAIIEASADKFETMNDPVSYICVG